jgi:hypothetical protein
MDKHEFKPTHHYRERYYTPGCSCGWWQRRKYTYTTSIPEMEGALAAAQAFWQKNHIDKLK